MTEITLDYINFIMEELLILVPVLLIIGKIIKISTTIPHRYIPLFLLVTSMVLTFTRLGINFESLVQSVLITGTAVFGHQLFKQMKEPKK
ncbi:holin [Halalkalibacillus sediminis]|uniref:Holin n=1 Tax=Halalkalibacillus sediminis TaxID=2018042 RepID=A0A2I0QVK6_9BACI|nr:phage holin family protein [Halalkalibacillus sediminis]PKR78382.1 holin [Halalkalibacillus sediminis]